MAGVYRGLVIWVGVQVCLFLSFKGSTMKRQCSNHEVLVSFLSVVDEIYNVASGSAGYL